MPDQKKTLTKAQWKRYQKRFDASITILRDLVATIRSTNPNVPAVVPTAGIEAVVTELDILMKDIKDATAQ